MGNHMTNRPLRVFLCHVSPLGGSSNDKPAALKGDKLYQKLCVTESTFAAVESIRSKSTVEIK